MRLLLIGVILYIAVTVYAVIDCSTSPSRDVRGLGKGAWIPLIILLPVVGAVLWFLFGRPVVLPESKRSNAPDDDPQFLRNLETWRAQQSREAALRKREEELKAREERLRRDDDGGDTGGSNRPATGH